MPTALIQEVEGWAKANGTSRSDAFRRLVEIGLSLAQPKQTSRARAKRAHDIAGKQLDQLADQTATTKEQARRKRRLLKGPEEFQKDRLDRTKT